MTSVLRGTRLLILLLLPPHPVTAQSAVERPPNLNGGWVAPPGVLQFNFLHRFDVSPPPERKVQNSPTFLVAGGLPGRAMVGFSYATNSDLVTGFPNEWEFFGRAMPLRQEDGRPLDLAVHAGYNQAAESIDAEVTAGRTLGPLGLFAAGRTMSNFAWLGERRFAVGAGATLRLGPWFGVTGDVSSLVDRADTEDLAWSTGVQFVIPYTPHTFSIHATSANTGTVQGASLGSGVIRFGFDYTVPVTLRRYFGRRPAPPPDSEPDLALRAGPETANDTVWAAIGSPERPLDYLPDRLVIRAGTTVVWTNNAPLAHTVTALDGSFDSDTIEPGASWSRTFPEPGTFAFTCTPHPFMRGTVVVRPPGSGPEP